jgi:recombination protein RecT
MSNQLTTISALLTKNKNQIQIALPAHMKTDRLIRVAMTEVHKNKDLLACDPYSVCGAVVQAAQLGLEPGGALGHCYLVPYKGKAQLQLGYRGMIDLARRSGAILSISARVVYEKDFFEYEFGLNERLEHKPFEGEDPGAPVKFYAVAHIKDGGRQFEVMTFAQVEKVRKKSPGANSAPWREHFEEMAKKTVIRRLFKYLPVSIELQRAVGLDEMAEAGVDQRNSSFIQSMDGEYKSDDPKSPIDVINAEVSHSKNANEEGVV